MKTFEMVRHNDESKISGTGNVLSGVIFDSGEVVVSWHSASNVNSLGIYKNYYEFYFIHCASHPTNNTQINFNEDKAEPVKKERRNFCRFCNNEYKDHPKDLQWEDTTRVRSCSGNLVELENNSYVH